MLKTVRDMAAGAVIAAILTLAISASAGRVGNPPTSGQQLVDGDWLIGLSQGNNFANQSGISAAGSNAATGTALSPNIFMYQVDTVAASTGVVLPYAVAPDVMMIRNGGANTLTIYSNPGTNAATGTTDTVNATTSITVTTGKSTLCFAAKNGAYSCLNGA